MKRFLFCLLLVLLFLVICKDYREIKHLEKENNELQERVSELGDEIYELSTEISDMKEQVQDNNINQHVLPSLY